MSTSKADGGFAFPFVTPSTDVSGVNCGLTLRDWFAGQALAAMDVKNDGLFSKMDHESGHSREWAYWYARAAYRVADAMLEMRKP